MEANQRDMRTLVVSDLHLGNGAGYDVFAGGEALPAFLDKFVSPPTRVIINGDGVDFLMNEDPLKLETSRAVEQAKAIAAEPSTRAVFAALGRVLAGGGEVIIRLGNHDIELALPAVQEVFRGALAQPADVSARLAFQTGEAPAIVDVGGAKILVTHGEHNDPWNMVDYSKLGKGDDYGYAPGSQLVKQLMNPLKRVYGLRFADLLKPDFQGAVLTGIAVAPTSMKLLLQKAAISIVWQVFRKRNAPAMFNDGEQELGIAERVEQAGLTEDEAAAVEALISPGAASFSEEDEGLLSGAAMKLLRAGLGAYARFQRHLVGTSGATYFELAPDEAEWKDAQRLAKKYGARAVLIGHTHAARWKADEGLVFANTGTWIWLMQLPSPDATADDWEKFLFEMKSNPGLRAEDGQHEKLLSRFTAVIVEPKESGGASLSLVEWDAEKGEIKRLGSSEVPAG